MIKSERGKSINVRFTTVTKIIWATHPTPPRMFQVLVLNLDPGRVPIDRKSKCLLISVQAATAADDSDRMRKVFESRAVQDEERMSKLEEELKDARTKAEDADKQYDEVSEECKECGMTTEECSGQQEAPAD